MDPFVTLGLSEDLTDYLSSVCPMQPLRNLTEIISKQVSQIEGDLKTKAAAYNNLKSTLQSMERKQVGSLLTR